ncbi:MAG: tetratricopeptide repeat protein [Verrucomicrobiales bacterium]
MRKLRQVDGLPFLYHNDGGSHRRRYVGESDVKVVLSRLPKPLWKRLEKVVFRDDWGRSRTLGYTLTKSRRDIALCNLPTRLSLRQCCALHGCSPEDFGAPLRGQWPALAIRRFQLYSTLLHEIGHLQTIHPNNSQPRRKFAAEPLAEEFAQEWRGRLWSEHFEHPDPVHNAPSVEEIALVRANWAEAHLIYREAMMELSKTGSGQRLRELEPCFQRAVDLFPQHSLAQAKLGQAIYVRKISNFEAALECFRRVLAVDPCHLDANLYGAMCLSRLQQDDEAREWFGRAIKLDQYAPLCRAVFAEELARMGYEDEAERLFRAILRANPADEYTQRAFAKFTRAVVESL